jgi:hypothetical protein
VNLRGTKLVPLNKSGGAVELEIISFRVAALVQQIFHISQQERKLDVQYHLQADDLWTGFEMRYGLFFIILKYYFSTLTVSTWVPLTMSPDFLFTFKFLMISAQSSTVQ